jgi:ribosomal-protein-alanine N-acetyltransferase
MRNQASAGGRTSPRMRVAPVSPDDVAVLARLLAESAGFHQPWVSYPTTPEAVGGFVGEIVAQGGVVFAARRLCDEALVGLVSLSRVTRGAWQSAECGCAVGVKYRGNGYMAEAMTEVVAYAMSRLGLHRIEALVQPGNTSSERMLAAAGFQAEGTARSSVCLHGIWRDQVRWAITAADLSELATTSLEGGEFCVK